MKFLSSSPEQTRLFAQKLAMQLRAGDTLLLYGDMGAGKSEFARGIVHGLGITGPVASPSFTIMQMYTTGRLKLYHFDWYRIASSEELYELGMDEYLNGDGVALVEWPTQAEDVLPETYLKVTLEPIDDSTRRITLESVGGFRALQNVEEV